MTFVFYKFALPVLLGYSVFMGVSGRLNCFSLPVARCDRSCWALGVWMGLVISLTLIFTTQVITGTVLDMADAMSMSTVLIMGGLIALALALFVYDRHFPIRIGKPSNQAEADEALHQGELEHVFDFDCTVMPDLLLDEPCSHSADLQDETPEANQTCQDPTPTSSSEADSESVEHPGGNPDMGQRLAESMAKTAALQADIAHEKSLRLNQERSFIELKQRVIKAKHEIRHSAAARARALSTANKSIAFARQSVQIRTRLESELEEAHATIDARQKTIGSLIKALEREKHRTQEEVSLIAKQLILYERQEKARRSLEGVARSVEDKLTSRLVKRIAKAKPLAPDTDQGSAS